MSGRRRGNQHIKGPVFRSFYEQNTRPREIMVWRPGLQSTRQQKRNLRTRARHLIDSTDPIVISVGDRVIRSVCEEPDPEFAALHLFCAALDMHDDTGEPWEMCMTYLMDKFDEQSGKEPDNAASVTPAITDQGASFLRRLLRSLVPRPLRASTEAGAKADVDQLVGADATSQQLDDAACASRPQDAGRRVATVAKDHA